MREHRHRGSEEGREALNAAAFASLWNGLYGKFRLRGERAAFRVPYYLEEPMVSMRLRAPRRGETPAYYNAVFPKAPPRPAPGFSLERDLRVVVYRRARELVLPRGYRACVGAFDDSALYAAYAAVTARVFPGGRKYPPLNRKLCAAMDVPSMLAVVYGPDGRPAAAGAVSCGKAGALLFGGAVMSSHRRKGLWTALLALRQTLARGRGLETCVLLTANPHLASGGEGGAGLAIYRRIR